MKRLFMAVVLTVALSGAALAGDVPSTDQPAPPPPNPIRSGAALAGDVPSTDQRALLPLNPMVSIILTVISAVS